MILVWFERSRGDEFDYGNNFQIEKKSERNTLRKSLELIILLTSWVIVCNIGTVIMSTIGKINFDPSLTEVPVSIFYTLKITFSEPICFAKPFDQPFIRVF